MSDHSTGRDGGDDAARIAALMGRMAAGDGDAVFDLYEEFGDRLAAVMRRHLAAVGVTGATRDDLEGLALDACLELASCAGAWRPDGGARPWTWAARRLRVLAARHAGIHTDELDEATCDQRAGHPARPSSAGRLDEASAFATLQQAAARHPLAALLIDGLALVGSPRDQAIVLELRLQADLGDPSPSHTVSADLGASPDAVRQVATRMRRRLRRLAVTDERFAPLADLPLVA